MSCLQGKTVECRQSSHSEGRTKARRAMNSEKDWASCGHLPCPGLRLLLLPLSQSREDFSGNSSTTCGKTKTKPRTAHSKPKPTDIATYTKLFFALRSICGIKYCLGMTSKGRPKGLGLRQEGVICFAFELPTTVPTA